MRNISLLFVLIILLISNNTNAQWVQANGPYGGVINCVAVHGNILFAGTNSGLYCSTDKGSSWNRVKIDTNRSQQILNVYDIQFKDSTIFISTSGNMWKSEDGGYTWKRWGECYPSGIQKFSIDNNYIAIAEFIGNGLGEPAYLNVAEILDNSYCPTYIGSLTVRGSYNQSAANITSIYLNKGFIVAGTNYGVFISSDTGKTWMQSNSNLADSNIIAVAMYNGKIFAGSYNQGIFCSSDSGKSWSECNLGLTVKSVKTISVNDGKIYAGTYGGGVFISTDSGVSWNPSGAELNNMVVNSICFDGDEPVAGTDGNGVYKYDGKSWMPINSGILATYINTFASIGSNLFAGTDGGGVYLSNDNGTSWSPVNSGMTSLNVNALAVKGTNLFAGTLRAGMFFSNDNGASWKEINNGIINKHIFDITVSGNNIFAGSSIWSDLPIIINSVNFPTWADSGLLYRSTDYGNSWTVVDTALAYVRGLASIDSNIFISYLNGIKRSTDAGESWENISLHYTYDRQNYITTVPEFTTKGNKLFAGTYGFGIYMYNVQDTSWETTSNTGLLNFMGYQQNLSYYQISAMASNDTALFAACEDNYYGKFGGLYISTDEGNNWKGINTPFESGSISGFLLQPVITSLYVQNNYLYAGTSGFGVWKISLSDIVTGIRAYDKQIITKYNLEQNYPNPFNPTTSIRYELPQSGNVTLKVYDILGREVQTLVNEYKNKGAYEISFNGANLASGVYLYKLKAGNFTSIKKMMLIK